MDVRRVASTWKVMMNPHDIEMENTYSVCFDTVLEVTNMRYFKTHQRAFDHHEKEREINRVHR